uniref:ShKT domain-containing protein n=1 Tax=Strongyloides papillosus TaxID=174720 RepID=A0A0N5B8U9_STREA
MKFLIYLGFIFGMLQSILSDDCKDLSSNCRNNLKHCRNSIYGPIMKKNCAKSCRYCIPPTRPTFAPILRDRIRNCSAMIERCHQKEYIFYMEKNCKKTCSTVTPKRETTTIAPEENTTITLEENSSKSAEVIEGSGTVNGDNNNEEFDITGDEK